MAEYFVYELKEDGSARHSPKTITAENDTAAYLEAAKIASAEDWVVEVWRGPVLVWHLEPSPGKRPRGLGSLVENLICDLGKDILPSVG